MITNNHYSPESGKAGGKSGATTSLPVLKDVTSNEPDSLSPL
jgi:hypothetical protein